MASGITIRIDVGSALREVRGLGQALDPKKLLTAIGFRQLAWIDQWIKSAGNDTWQRMSFNTIAANPARPMLNNFTSRYLTRLHQSMTSEVDVGRGTVDVGTNDRYAEWQSEGTRPYDIRPKNGNFLVFKVFAGASGTFKGSAGVGIKYGRDTVFTKVVHHPGIPARRLIPTQEVATRLAQEVVDAAVTQALKNFQGPQGRA